MRGIVIGFCSALFLVTSGTGALACDTGSWLQVSGAAGAGTPVTVHGGGLEPGPLTLVWDRSGGEILGSASVTLDGRMAVDVQIPATAAGRHKIIAVPAAAAGSPVDLHAWTDVVVASAVVEPRPAPVSTGQATAESSLGKQVGAGLAALLVVFLGLAARRRRAAVRAAAGSTREIDGLDTELAEWLGEHEHERPSVTGSPAGP
ncbi:MYXO-CTERM domain-containing protein [Blastococcus colisei]|uniref:MYXO-CTERM domain-containing protein n=2 Tax=Blastococcus colisei TaxID=1564162 RepID=A0A543PET9_9ACTN|nr:MYXO-CTERM domain-containing protein [Blastococcus colisei]